MDSRVSLLAAGALILGALVVGYWGLKMGGRNTPDSPAISAPTADVTDAKSLAEAVDQLQTSSVVVLLKDMPIHSVLKAEDIALLQVPVAPPGSFQSLDTVVGKQVQMPLAAGSWLNQEIFESGSQIAHLIRPDERALAINVDEIVATGGHLRPGDYVDVLLHMNLPDAELRGKQEAAQVVLQALRVLSFGKALVPRADSTLAAPKSEDEQQSGIGRSVVLAVPKDLANRLLLASQVGTLRLAIRSADEGLAQLSQEQAAELAAQASPLLQLNNLTGSASNPPPRTAPPVTARASSQGRSVEVIRGTESSQQTP